MEIKLGYKQTELELIPDDWEVISLRELGNFKNGINKGKEDFGFGYPFVNLLDVFGKAQIQPKSSFGLVNSTQADRKVYDLKKGDVLFVRSSVKPEGVGLTTRILEDFPNAVYSGFLIRFRVNGKLFDGFKEYCFADTRFRDSLIASSTVSANTNINQDALKALVISVPPLPEQQSIAVVLNDVDALITSLDALIAKKRAIKQGVMQELLTGKRRLPGFNREWVEKKLGDIGVIDPENLTSETVEYFV